MSTGTAAGSRSVGSIAASDATRKLCEGYLTFKALGPAKVKGLGEPVAVHEVTGSDRYARDCNAQRPRD